MRTLIRTAAMLFVAAGLIGGAATMTATPAKAAGITVDLGARHHHHWWRHHHHRWWRHHRHCRVVVRHKWRHGHRITIRRRTCW